MKKIFVIFIAALVAPWAVASPKAARSGENTNAAPAKNIPVAIPQATNAPVLTTNTVTIAGEQVTYRAETGMLPDLEKDGTSGGAIFYVAYTRLGNSDRATRPVTFCFNGGPGSSSVWLHLGAFGPRRVKLNDNGTMPPPPFQIEDNHYSILNASDLVFIDPIATGYSRATDDKKPRDFFGNTADLDSMGEFIRLWTSRHDRWLSPKFLCGESYGVFRAAGLAEHLRNRYGMYLNGLILNSGVLDFETIADDPGNDVPYPLFLPAYTAAAHYHKKLPPDLQNDLDAALKECRQFARGEYTAALQQGASLSAAERERVVSELARLTGLKTNVIID
ncbi:MAG: S10 family peptidase, partial [Limisphaerales bacterium]